MHKILIIILFVLFSSAAQSQIQTVYFDAKDQVTADSTLARSYGIYGKVTGEQLWVFKKYDIDGVLMVTGAFKDDLLSLPQGKFVYYDWVDASNNYANLILLERGIQRYVLLSGNFENGLKHGRWTSFYENGDVKSVSLFEAGILHGDYISFDRNGDMFERGTFVNNKKEGTWQLSGGLKVVEYKNDQVISVTNKTKRQLKAEQQNKQ